MSWIEENGPSDDIVVSSRVRLARNIASLPFPTIMDSYTADDVVDKVSSSILKVNDSINSEFSVIKLNNLTVNERNLLVEEHMCSPDLVKNHQFGVLVTDSKRRISIMINEEDHIRMQCICPGIQLTYAWNVLNKLDDLIEESLQYSFDEQLGYLTSCPTNLGTGLRASLMMHLSALKLSKQLESVFHAISKVGMTARGLYGEGSEAAGDLFQISNQVSLGLSENEIINNINIIGQQIIDKEMKAREVFYDADKAEFEDRVFRAYGVLKYSRKLGINEFMQMLAYIRLGISMGIIRDFNSSFLNTLMVAGQPAHLKNYIGKDYNDAGMDIFRAEVIRKFLNRTDKS